MTGAELKKFLRLRRKHLDGVSSSDENDGNDKKDNANQSCDSDADWEAMAVAKKKSLESFVNERRTKSQPPPVQRQNFLATPAEPPAQAEDKIDSEALKRALSLAQEAFGEVEVLADPINSAYANMVSEARR